MKRIIIVIKYILILILSDIVSAQTGTAVPFLLYNPSPKLNGMAGTFTALPTNDVYNAFFNPAQLGNLNRDNNMAIGFYPIRTDWMPNVDISDVLYHAHAFTFRYKFKSSIPVNVGFAYIYSKMDWGENVWTDAAGNELGRFPSYESCNAFSLGLGFEYMLQFNFGMTLKDINLRLIPDVVKIGAAYRGGNGNVLATDYGILITAPLIKIFNAIYSPLNDNHYTPFLDLSIGCSIHNIGDEIRYGITAQDDPLPRQTKAPV